MYIYAHMYAYICICMYIYIYIFIYLYMQGIDFGDFLEVVQAINNINNSVRTTTPYIKLI